MTANKCPKCEKYIFGSYCSSCDETIQKLDLWDIMFGGKIKEEE